MCNKKVLIELKSTKWSLNRKKMRDSVGQNEYHA